MKNYLLFVAIFVGLVYFSKSIADSEIIIADFSNNNIKKWEPHSFQGTTEYKLFKDNEITVLKAVSQNAASGLVKKQQIDLTKTPFLNWSWKVEHSLYRLTETFKKGDDFAARIYVVKDGGVFFWRTLALNYVWSSGQAKLSTWDNPFTGNAKMISIQSGNSLKQQWVTEKRNVYEDFKKVFGQNVRFIDAVAIMTDTDNSGQSATAYYGDIFFSDK